MRRPSRNCGLRASKYRFRVCSRLRWSKAARSSSSSVKAFFNQPKALRFFLRPGRLLEVSESMVVTLLSMLMPMAEGALRWCSWRVDAAWPAVCGRCCSGECGLACTGRKYCWSDWGDGAMFPGVAGGEKSAPLPPSASAFELTAVRSLPVPYVFVCSAVLSASDPYAAELTALRSTSDP